MANLIDTKEKTLTIDISSPIESITKINGDSKQCLQGLLTHAHEVVMLGQNWSDHIFQSEYEEMLSRFIDGNTKLTILLCSDIRYPSPAYISKHLKFGNEAKVKAYLVDNAVSTSLFRLNESKLPEYPIIGDDRMYHLRSYEVKGTNKVWFSRTSLNDTRAVKSIRNRFDALLSLPTTARY